MQVQVERGWWRRSKSGGGLEEQDGRRVWGGWRNRMEGGCGGLEEQDGRRVCGGGGGGGGGWRHMMEVQIKREGGV